MAKLSLDLNETVSVKPDVEIKKEEPVALKFKQRIPSDWNVTLVKAPNVILATSNMGDKFEGTIEDFNKALRG